MQTVLQGYVSEKGRLGNKSVCSENFVAKCANTYT